jgi:hypothetical protein
MNGKQMDARSPAERKIVALKDVIRRSAEKARKNAANCKCCAWTFEDLTVALKYPSEKERGRN